MDKMQKIKKILGRLIKNPSNIDCFAEEINQHADWEDVLHETMYNLATGEKGKAVKDSFRALQNRELGFNGPVYKKYAEIRDAQDEYVINPPEVVEGALECEKCGSKRVLSFTLQTKSGDESTSVFAKCVECTYDWRPN
jgi:DNA-directed RNA polymerase subunit M/transcription elongation factor TFIIS